MSKCYRVENVITDFRVELDNPEGYALYSRTIDDRIRDAKARINELESVVRDVSFTIIYEQEDQCSECGATWEEDITEQGKQICAHCGSIVEKEKEK